MTVFKDYFVHVKLCNVWNGILRFCGTCSVKYRCRGWKHFLPK